MSKNFGEDNKLIQSEVGEEVEIELPGNFTTGYIWRQTAPAKNVEIDEGTFSQDEVSFGGGGVQRFQVRPTKQGKVHLRFEYVQPWEGIPAEVREFDLEVKPKNK